MMLRFIPDSVSVVQHGDKTLLVFADNEGSPVQVELYPGLRTTLADKLRSYASVLHNVESEAK